MHLLTSVEERGGVLTRTDGHTGAGIVRAMGGERRKECQRQIGKQMEALAAVSLESIVARGQTPGSAC